MSERPSWETGLAILRERQASLPELAARALAAPLPLAAAAAALRDARAVVTTGVGSSLAHARYLAWLLRSLAGVPAWEEPTGAFLAPPPDAAADQVLVVFSQGLSPNARVPLAHVARYRAVVLVTAAATDAPGRAAAVHEAAAAGALVVPLPCPPEYQVLLRLSGPLVGFVVALRLAHAVAPERLDLPEPAALVTALHAAITRARTALAGAAPGVLADPVVLVGTHGHAALAGNLAAKVLEGMFLPLPPALDALELAHGAIQEASGKPRTFVALGRGEPDEEALLARARATTEPQHRWLSLAARLPGPLALLEHEVMANELVLAAIAARRLDQLAWPGKGHDGPLYALASAADLAAPAPEPGPRSSIRSHRLEDLTWPEIEAELAAGRRTVVFPLGATEQHGPHLPLAVDTWIADALAARFCARVPEALAAPVAAVGASVEHLAFPGTLSVAPENLVGALGDRIAAAVGHGFSHVVVFSAHGGNDRPLADAEATLRARAAPARLTVIHGIDAIARLWQEASKSAGAPPGAAGHHAGEFETSIVAALRPDAIRYGELRAGISGDVAEPQHLFYPSLRDHAPEGVVGDPSAASGARGEAYLAAWTAFLVEHYHHPDRVDPSPASPRP